MKDGPELPGGRLGETFLGGALLVMPLGTYPGGALWMGICFTGRLVAPALVAA